MILYYLTLLLIPFNTHPWLSYNIIPGPLPITPIKVIGGMAFLWALMSYSGAHGASPTRSTSRSVFFTFVGLALVSLIANAATINPTSVMRFSSILLFAFTTLVLVNTRDKLFWSCIFLLLGMNIADAYIVRQYLQSPWRPGGTFGDPNYYAASAIAVLPLAYYMWAGARSRWTSLFCLASMAATTVGVLLSQSRGGFLGLAAVLVMMVWVAERRVRSAVVICVAGILLLALSPVDPTTRFLDEGHGDMLARESRITLFYGGLDMVHDRPIVGFGIGNFKLWAPEYAGRSNIAHNSYIELAAEKGVPVLIAFLLMCAAVMKDIAVGIRVHHDDRTTQGILVGIRAGLVGFLVAAVSVSAQYETLFWVLCFLTMASLKLETPESLSDIPETRSRDSDVYFKNGLHPGMTQDPVGT